MGLIAIYNPICGDGTAKAFFDDRVFPLLARYGRTVDKVVATEFAGHAGQILADYLESNQGDVAVILGSGDGTLHEIINHLSATIFDKPRAEGPLSRILFVLVPCGTANALFHSLFPPGGQTAILDPVFRCQSVQSFIHSSSIIPLKLAIATLSSSPNAKRPPRVTISSVVVSTSLHASILHHSESIRREVPGVERFKVAAERNSTKWYNGYVKLLPASATGVVQIYDSVTQTFLDHPDSDKGDPTVDLDGPFAYFLSTVNVDRLEPGFIITPLARLIPPTEAVCEVVIVRPLRDPSLTWDDLDAREAFKPKLWAVLGAAYQAGTHINLRYDHKGNVITGGDGPTVVEYIRCGGWEWIPNDFDEAAHLLCSDGAISYIEKGGRVVCSAATVEEGTGFAVCG